MFGLKYQNVKNPDKNRGEKKKPSSIMGSPIKISRVFFFE